MCKNADRLFVNVKEHDADVLFKVCASVVLAERWDVHVIERRVFFFRFLFSFHPNKGKFSIFIMLLCIFTRK